MTPNRIDINSRVAEPNSREAKFEADTFPYLWDLAKNKPEAGIHFKRRFLHAVLVFQFRGSLKLTSTSPHHRKQDTGFGSDKAMVGGALL